VVVLTGRADEEVSLRSVREGAQDYLLKGDLTPVVLDRAIRYAIERNRMQNNERFLTKVRTLLSSTLDYDDVIRKLAELAVRSLGEHCCIDMVTEDGTLRRLGVAHRMPLPDELGEALRRYPVRLDRGYFQNLRESRRPVRVETVTTADLEMLSHDAEHLRLLQQLRPRSLVVVPLFAGEQFIGMMTFVSVSRSFDEDDEALAEKIGLIAVPGLVNSRLYERAREAVRARDRILGIVAHDLRNPLSTIAMSVDLLLGSSLLPDRRAQLLDIIRRSTTRMDRLIQDLLDIARIESDQLQLCLEHQNSVQLAREAVDLNLALAADRGLILQFEPTGERPQPVRADRDRILQVLANLIGNAIKFTPAGGRVTVRVHPFDQETHFSVADTGPGMTPD
jgi:signal transduction histidine kinase